MGTSVTHAGFLTALYVPLVPVLGWLLWRPLPHWSIWPAGLACVGGAYLLSGAGADGMTIGRGDWWVIGSALPWALHVLLVGRVAHRLQAAALPIGYAGILSVGVAFTAQVVAQRYAQAADAAIVLSAETLFAALFGFVLMGDRLPASGLIGCALIFVSMVAVQLLPLLNRRRALVPAPGHGQAKPQHAERV